MSISQFVTDFLAALARAGDEQHAVHTPTVRQLLGLLPSETELDVTDSTWTRTTLGEALTRHRARLSAL